MLLLNKKLALIVLMVLPVILVLTVVFRKFSRRSHRLVRNEVSNMNAFSSENISGMKITQIFNQEEKKYNEFKEANNRLKKSSVKEIFTFGIFRPSVYLVYILTVILIIYVGSNEAIDITIGENLKLKTRLVDCVGYLVNNAIGYLEDDVPRMVRTPWSEDEIPFETAAEIGTRKVIQEHSTIGLVIDPDAIHIMKKSEYSGLYGDYSSFSDEMDDISNPDVTIEEE